MAERVRGKTKRAAKSAKGKGGKAKKAGIGHNSGQVPDEVYERHLRKIDQTANAMDKAKEVYDQAKGVHQSAYKAAKEDGCNIDGIKLARKLDQQDAGAVVINYADTGRILRLMRSPLSVQMSLFDDIQLPKDVQAAMDGKNAGRLSAARDTNPHQQGTAEYEHWDSSWVAAQQELSPELRAN